MLKFECKMSNQLKYSNLSEKVGIYQSAAIWLLSKIVGIDQNVEIQVKWYESIKMLKFQCKIPIQTKCCNLNEKVGIDQNVEIWVQNVGLIKCCNLCEKVGINKNVEIWSKR